MAADRFSRRREFRREKNEIVTVASNWQSKFAGNNPFGFVMNTVKPTINVTSISHPPFGTNTYFLTQDESVDCLVIDPGGWGSSRVEEKLSNLGYKVKLVILTHEHFDHLGSLSALRERWPCQVICSRICSTAMADPVRNFSRYLVNCDIACKVNVTCCEDISSRLQWNNMSLQFLSTPGHSPGSICIAVENLLFSGDTLLFNRKQAINLPGGDKLKLRQSVEHLFRSCASDTIVYPGHGEPFALQQAQVNLPGA